MEKVGQIYERIDNGLFIRIDEIKDDKIYYSLKLTDRDEWEREYENGRHYTCSLGFSRNKNSYRLVKDIKNEIQEIFIPVSRLSKIE